MTEPPEPIVVVISPTARDYRRSLRSSRRAALWRIRIAGVVVVLAGATLLVLGEDFFFLAGLLFILFGAGFIARSYLLPGVIVRRLPPASFAQHRLEIGPAGIAMGTEVYRGTYAWAGFRSAVRKPEQWVLQHRDGQTRTNIGLRHFTPDQQERVEALFREHGLL